MTELHQSDKVICYIPVESSPWNNTHRPLSNVRASLSTELFTHQLKYVLHILNHKYITYMTGDIPVIWHHFLRYISHIFYAKRVLPKDEPAVPALVGLSYCTGLPLSLEYACIPDDMMTGLVDYWPVIVQLEYIDLCHGIFHF